LANSSSSSSVLNACTTIFFSSDVEPAVDFLVDGGKNNFGFEDLKFFHKLFLQQDFFLL